MYQTTDFFQVFLVSECMYSCFVYFYNIHMHLFCAVGTFPIAMFSVWFTVMTCLKMGKS